MPIELPAMLAEQQGAWQAVFEIHSAMPQGWVLVGGQALFLHPLWQRHIDDFLTLASVVRASDLRNVTYKRAERDHLANMLGRLANEPELMEQVPEGAEGVERLRISLN
ncbi:hypothetical protein [Arthrobacter sp. NtRootA1]|uniref:hypothetical protein n=1 Tax=Arthrobacter sp. NtRootA1 TaxID=2830983 RepID=UPI001CC7B618|nr:hypothetical protein [Arthrobacter sp. NtRootA1]BCW08214.1 hypothetical protein NtRootA1_43520 [Arthrobacter sp. NtRootA1]